MTANPTQQAHRVLGVMDEFIANMTKARDDLQAVLDAIDPPQTEPTATVETMTVGGWLQRPGSPRWLPIAGITQCDEVDPGCFRIDLDLPATDRDGICFHVGADDSFPFLTAEQFDRACADEQAVTHPEAA